MIKKLVAIGLALTSASAIAWSPFDSKTALYECTNLEAAQACSSGCKSIGTKIQYKVNPSNNTVMQSIYYDDGSVGGTDALDNCMVVDQKNWVCQSSISFSSGSTHDTKTTMTNGRLFFYSDIYKPRGKSKVSYGCGK